MYLVSFIVIDKINVYENLKYSCDNPTMTTSVCVLHKGEVEKCLKFILK